RSRSLRRLVRCRLTRKRNAGNCSVFGFWRMMRGISTGTPISTRPPRMKGKTKLIARGPPLSFSREPRVSAWPSARPRLAAKLEALLPLQQILHQRPIETDTRIHRHVINVRPRALPAVILLELAERLQVVGLHAARVDRQALVLLDVLEL